MKAPWKYRKVSAGEFDRIHYRYQTEAGTQRSPSAYYGDCLGSNWYRKGMEVFWDVVNNTVRHWTRWKPCCDLRPGEDIVDCLAGIRNRRGNLSWLVGQHYVGMCPFKRKWQYKLVLKSWTGRKGRT